MKISFPDISSDLAVAPHMYICQKKNKCEFSFVKCQTLKPWMLTHRDLLHYLDEAPDINRNPFKHMTRIDCDKLFISSNVQYDDSMKTTLRPDVCEDIICRIDVELEADSYDSNSLNENELVQLNRLISKVKK